MGRQRFFGNKGHGVIFISEAIGVADVVDGEVIVIGTKTYEFDDDASVGAGNILVDMSGAPDGATVEATLVAAINANKPSVPVTAVAHPGNPAVSGCVLISADARAGAGNMVFTTTMATGTSAISGAGLLEFGEDGGSQVESRVEWVVSPEDVLATMIAIETGMNSPRFADATVRTAAGVVKAWDGALTVVGSQIRLAIGAVAWAATDVVTVTYWE